MKDLEDTLVLIGIGVLVTYLEREGLLPPLDKVVSKVEDTLGFSSTTGEVPDGVAKSAETKDDPNAVSSTGKQSDLPRRVERREKNVTKDDLDYDYLDDLPLAIKAKPLQDFDEEAELVSKKAKKADASMSTFPKGFQPYHKKPVAGGLFGP